MDEIKELLDKALQAVSEAKDGEGLEAARVRFLGKKGELTALLRGMGQLPAQERPAFGARVNAAREELERAIAQAKEARRADERARKLKAEAIDVTWPAPAAAMGALHPMETIQRQVEQIFLGMGYTVAEGPDVELDKYNFELLNVPAGHPARDMQDTFYFTDSMLLRTQTSAVQARYMTTHRPPIRIICPGRVYRADEVDASHSPVFHQMEGLVVDHGITMAHLRGALDAFAKALYGDSARIRFRPSYFPFTEPSAEVDISCTICGGKGCRTCKGSGWLEVLGAGMVHPNVLSACGIDATEYTGFAFGIGLERIAMLKYGISDMRLLYENDMRFLTQFGR
nr:phenylalanine--tRNA ligase subunit alpha [bacterium]